MQFKDYEQFQAFFIKQAKELASIQEEMSPELFAPLADYYLKTFAEQKELFDIQQNQAHEIKKAKYIFNLTKKGWKKQLRDWFSDQEKVKIVQQMVFVETPSEETKKDKKKNKDIIDNSDSIIEI